LGRNNHDSESSYHSYSSRTHGAFAAAPDGTVSVFLLATVVLGLTALFFLWQSGTGLKSEYQVQHLQAYLSSLQSETIRLQNQAFLLRQTSLPSAARYGMSLYNAAPQRVITATLPSGTLSTANAQDTAPLQATIRLSTTSTATGSWAQSLWTAFYNAFH